MNIYERIRVLSTALDVFKTIFAGLFVWSMIKRLFPNIDDSRDSTEFLAILVIGFAVVTFYASIKLANIERELNDIGDK